MEKMEKLKQFKVKRQLTDRQIDRRTDVESDALLKMLDQQIKLKSNKIVTTFQIIFQILN